LTADIALRVRHADLRALGYCNRGARAWAARQGLDWAAFLSEGLPADRLLVTGDAQALAAVREAERRSGRGPTGRDGSADPAVAVRSPPPTVQSPAPTPPNP
jgi:hypothetical protein